MPAPLICSTAVGLTPPGCPPAPLKKLLELICGPGSRTVRLKTALKLLTVAVTVNAPGVAPAVAMIEACPCALVVAAPLFDSVTPPLAVNCTCTPAAGPCAEFACTISGWANAVLITAIWVSPATLVKPVIGTLT